MTDAITIEMSEEIGELAKALPEAQKAIGKISRDATNPHFNNKYASLSEIRDAVVPALNDHGITVLQPTTADGAAVYVTTILLHTSAQWLRSTHRIPVSRIDAQGVGSAVTYAKRQALQALMVVAAPGEDDDAEGAVGRGAGRPPLPPSEPSRPTLEQRKARLRQTLGEVRTVRDLVKAWDLGKELRAELAEKDPQGAADLDAFYETRHRELIGAAG
jgi:hypothetical protein